MAGFEVFLGSLTKGLGDGLANGLLSFLPAIISKDYRKRLFGSGLTTSEKEANAFSANQADIQRDWQQQMSNTQYQRGVVDMQKAGLNPALMMSGASGASTPSGASVSSVTPSQSDPMGMISQIAQLSLLKSQKRNIDADTQTKLADAEYKKSQTTINGILAEYLPDMQQSTIANIRQSIDESVSRIGLNTANVSAIEVEKALKNSQISLNELEKEWRPALYEARSQSDKASAAYQFAQAAYQRYFTQYTKANNGQTPGYNQILGIGYNIADFVAKIFGSDGVPDLGNLIGKAIVDNIKSGGR